MSPASSPAYLSSSEVRCGEATGSDRTALTFGRDALGLGLGFGLAPASALTMPVVRLAAALGRAVVAFGRAEAAGLAVLVDLGDPADPAATDLAPGLADLALLVPALLVPALLVPALLVPALVPALLVPAMAVPGLAVPGLAVPGLAVPGLAVPGLAAPDGLAAALGLDAAFGAATRPAADVILAPDIALAAAVSDLAAVVMALVAAFIACMAVDMVLAEDVALVAAAVILVAAEVTFVAAEETVRAATAGEGAAMEVAVRVDLAAVVLLLAFLCGWLEARRGALLLVDLVCALAGLRRAAVRVVVRAGTDLPPV